MPSLRGACSTTEPYCLSKTLLGIDYKSHTLTDTLDVAASPEQTAPKCIACADMLSQW